MGMELLVSTKRGLCKIFAYKSISGRGRKIDEIYYKWHGTDVLIYQEEFKIFLQKNFKKSKFR